jgi:hypothetical protein
MRRSSDSNALKGVTIVRGDKAFAVNLPKFTPPPNANTINVNRDDVHEQFRKLTPKQRIAVMTIRDPKVIGKLYSCSNALWYNQINVMRSNVGTRNDSEVLSRTFFNSFEYLFGQSDDLNDSDHEDTQPLLGKKTVQSSCSTATNRPINSTFSYGSSTPTVFKPKLNFISTKDVLKVMIDGSKDFCASKARSRSRLLQRPEMWDRIFDVKEEVSAPDYECLIYQLMEFRVLYEYLNGGSGGEPFSNIKKGYPTDDAKWAKKEKAMVDMEEGSSTSTAPTTPAVSEESPAQPPAPSGPKKTRKKRLLEKIAASRTVDIAPSRPADNTSSSSSSEDEKSEESPVTTPAQSIPPLAAPVTVIDSEEDNDEWIEVGIASKPKKPSEPMPESKQPALPAPMVRAKSNYVFADSHREFKFKVWSFSEASQTYVSDTLQAATSRTFVEVVPIVKRALGVRECPF